MFEGMDESLGFKVSGELDTEDKVAIADGHGSQWHRMAAEEVIRTPLPFSLEAAFGNTLSEGAWASLADGMATAGVGLRTIITDPFHLPQPTHHCHT